MNEIKDQKHAKLLNILIEYLKWTHKYSSISNTKLQYKVEYQYNYYGEKGWIDLIEWEDSGRTIEIFKKKLVHIYEVKPVIIDLGETIRQLHKYKNYISSQKDIFFGENFGKRDVASSLVLFATMRNWDIIAKNRNILEGSTINTLKFFSDSHSFRGRGIPPNKNENDPLNPFVVPIRAIKTIVHENLINATKIFEMKM